MNTAEDTNNKKKVVVVTGSSSGIGFETSLSLVKRGFVTYATMRNLAKSNKIIARLNLSSMALNFVSSAAWK